MWTTLTIAPAFASRLTAIRHVAYSPNQEADISPTSFMQLKETLVRNLQAEIDALEEDPTDPNEYGLFPQVLFVLFCTTVGVGVAEAMAWLLTTVDAQTFGWTGIALPIIFPLICAAIAIGTIVYFTRNGRRLDARRQELRELQHGSHDEEFATGAPDIHELNDLERFIVGKPEATVDQLMAHPRSRAIILPWWQLIGLPGWHLPAAFITTLALNVLAGYVLLPLYSLAAVILMVVAPILMIIVFLRWRMFRITNYNSDSRPTLLSLLTSKSGASFYQHWLLLRRLKGKGLIDPNRMEPFEEVFLTTNYLFAVFYPLAAVLPIELLTVNSTKLKIACNCLSGA